MCRGSLRSIGNLIASTWTAPLLIMPRDGKSLSQYSLNGKPKVTSLFVSQAFRLAVKRCTELMLTMLESPQSALPYYLRP